MQEKQRAFLVRTAYWAVWAVLLWLGVRYLLRWLLPFLLALALAAAVEPVIAWCRRRMGLKRGFTAAVVTIAVTGAILALAAVIVWQLIRQAAELLGQLPGLLAGLPGMTEDLRQRLEDFCAACPQGLRSWLEEVPALLGTLAAGVAQRASGACITAAAALAAALPGVFLFCGTTALAVFFTAGSYPRVMAFFRRQLGHRLDRARGVKANLLSTLGKWCRAQAILLGVTFCELLAGFLLMGQRYALLLAAVVIGVLSLVRGYFILLPPTHMQLNGRTEEHISAFAAYTDPGARLLRGGDPTDAAVTVEGKVNTDVPGDYTLTYQADFRGRSYTAKRLVHVEDREAPELTLTGQAEVTVSRYDLFQDPGATARDRCDGDLTASIQVTDKASGDVHTLTYTVTDKAGNAATATRRVTVRDIVAPVITLSGQRELFVPLGGTFRDPGATAQDDADGDLTASVTRAGTVNTASPGVYTLTYTVSDKAGNTSSATRQVSVYENSSGGSPVYLTFDDGPSDRVTPRVLDTLKEYNIHATFFIVNYGESGKALIRRMIDEGHTVAIHGYSHDYAAIYKSDEAFMQNIYRLRDRLRSDFGYEAAIIRFPGGSSNTVSRQYSVGIMSRLAQRVQAEGFTYFDWNVSSGDAAGTPASSGQIYNNVTSALRHDRGNVVLMHDAGAKGTTADALPDIIRYCLANGYSIQPITPATKPVHHGIAN